MFVAKASTLRLSHQPLREKRRGVSELIGILLMVFIVMAAAVLIVPYLIGLFSSLTGGGTSSLIVVNGQMSVPGTYDSYGLLSMTLTNRASSSIQSISFQCVGTIFAFPNCTNGGFKAYYNGKPVSAVNLLPVGMMATGNNITKSSSIFTAGTTYTVLVTVTFVTGSDEEFSVNIPSTS